MKRNRSFLAAAFVFAAATAALAATDPYVLFDRFLERPRIPRLLSTVDFGLSEVQPEALQPVRGDFDGDGKPDVALSGVYTLPGKTPDYFLLVVGDEDSRDPKKLFEKFGPRPLYLFAPGATGDGDPGTQAFSAADCINCSTGTDFVWDRVIGTFRETPWHDGQRLKALPIKNMDVDPKVADAALRVAGRLPDVRHFVSEVGRRGSQLVTRVEAVPEAQDPERARVLIFERSKAGDELYDAIEVDTKKGRVVKRGEKGGARPNPQTDPPEDLGDER